MLYSRRCFPGRSRPNRVRSRRSPRLESLETRNLPSAFTVTNTLDSGSGSLRAEVALAQTGDTVSFAPGLSGKTIKLNSGEIIVQNGISIVGPGADKLTISGGGSSPRFRSLQRELHASDARRYLDHGSYHRRRLPGRRVLRRRDLRRRSDALAQE